MALNYCPNHGCPGNVPYVSSGLLCFMPRMIDDTGPGYLRCPLCAELLQDRCSSCGAPPTRGAFCTRGGQPYVVARTRLTETGSVREWADSQRALIKDLALLTEPIRFHLRQGMEESEPEVSSEDIRVAVQPVSQRLMELLAERPEMMHELAPREFEEVVAELLSRMGCDVQLTPRTGDEGRDILAVMPTPLGRILLVVECKRYAPHRPIGPGIIRQLLYVADRKDQASLAMLATSSLFTRGARRLERQNRWRLVLGDFHDISMWLKQYGLWRPTDFGGFWVPGAGMVWGLTRSARDPDEEEMNQGKGR